MHSHIQSIDSTTCTGTFSMIEEIHTNRCVTLIQRERANSARELVLGCLILYKSVIQNACWKSRGSEGKFLFEYVKEIENLIQDIGNHSYSSEDLQSTLSRLGAIARLVDRQLNKDDHDTLYLHLNTTYRLLHKFEYMYSYHYYR